MENQAPKDVTWQVSKVPPGSIKTVACEERSGKMNRFCKVGTLNSGGPESAPAEAARRPTASGVQPQGDVTWTFRESDPPIVVRDGNAGHRAKEWAGKQRKHSTHQGNEYSLTRCHASCLQWELVLALCVSAGSVCALS